MLFDTAKSNLDSKNDEMKIWAQHIYNLSRIFRKENLDYLEKNLKTAKYYNFNLLNLSPEIINDDLIHMKQGGACLYVYLKEWHFRRGIKQNETEVPPVRNFYNFMYTNKVKNYSDLKNYFDFVDEIPFLICGEIYSDSKLSEIRKFLEEKDFSDFKAFIQTNESTFQAIKTWEANFKHKEQLVLDLEKRLDESKKTYDFVLLNKGFKELYDQKKEELKNIKNTYSFVAATMFFIPFVELGALIAAFIYFDGKLPTGMWFTSIPFITLILITLYLLKISLQEKRSIQSQMMQLELRMALCQFIHNYADDSEKLHAKNKAGFEKFENIIFSPLVSSDDKIPTTFDGMEQLAKLVSEFRK